MEKHISSQLKFSIQFHIIKLFVHRTNCFLHVVPHKKVASSGWPTQGHNEIHQIWVYHGGDEYYNNKITTQVSEIIQQHSTRTTQKSESTLLPAAQGSLNYDNNVGFAK
jgi:hypothetical protein